MKFKEIVKIIEDNDINWKLVNDTVVIYPDDYNTSDKGDYLWLGEAIYDEESDLYNEFEFSDNFDEIPEDIQDWLNRFAEFNERKGYSHA